MRIYAGRRLHPNARALRQASQPATVATTTSTMVLERIGHDTGWLTLHADNARSRHPIAALKTLQFPAPPPPTAPGPSAS